MIPRKASMQMIEKTAIPASGAIVIKGCNSSCGDVVSVSGAASWPLPPPADPPTVSPPALMTPMMASLAASLRVNESLSMPEVEEFMELIVTKGRGDGAIDDDDDDDDDEDDVEDSDIFFFGRER